MKEENKLAKLEWLVIALLVIVFITLFVYLINDYRHLRQSHIVGSYRTLLEEHLKHGPLTETDIQFIRVWMTFNYINKVFAIPQDYLQTSLNITDPHYPNILISSYAKEIGTTTTNALDEVQNAVQLYLQSKNR